MENRINWYPGHMAKARRLLSEQLGRADVVIELCDARLPFSSRNPDLDALAAGKPRVLILNKADLADPDVTAAWLRHFRSKEIQALAFQSTSGKGLRNVLDAIGRASSETVRRASEKGVRKTVRAIVIGVPNVGKSTFINRMHGTAIAKTGDRPGVTKSQQWIHIGEYLDLLDTPGMLWPRLDDQTAAKRLCYIGTVKDDILDLQALTISLLEDMLAAAPDTVTDRFHLSDPSLRGEALLEAVCRGRGFLLRGGLCDVDRCCPVVLDEFRAGKLGRLSLEVPDFDLLLNPEPEMPKDGDSH